MTYPAESPEQPPPTRTETKPSKFGGLAWASVILGIVGIVGSPIILLNNATAVAAGVGFVLGAVAILGTRKILAAVGIVLCVLAITFTVIAQDAAVKAIDDAFSGSVNEGRVSNGETSAYPVEQTGAGEQPGAAPSAPTWGQRYTWKDGLAVEVSAPATCTPGEYAQPSNIARAVKVTVTVVNGTDEGFDTATLSFGSDAQFDGKNAEEVFDSNGPCGGGGSGSATVLPGKTYTYEMALAVGEQSGELQIALQPHFGADKAVFVGRG